MSKLRKNVEIYVKMVYNITVKKFNKGVKKMKMSKSKILALVLLTVIMLFSILQIHSLAASKEMLVLKQSDNQYIIYIQDLLNKKFEFAFSNTEDAKNLNYITYAKEKGCLLTGPQSMDVSRLNVYKGGK